jgi:hypothetical protein
MALGDLPFNRLVDGSNLSRRTIYVNKKARPRGLAFLFLIVALMIETFILSVKVECGKALGK